MNEQQIKQAIIDALGRFKSGSLLENALHLFATLGYTSDKRLELEPNTVDGLLEAFPSETFNAHHALTDQWRSVDLLFQLADDDLHNNGQTGSQFDSSVNQQNPQSYLVFAVELHGDQ